MPAAIATGTSQGGYTLTVARPSGVAAGDLLVAHITSDGDDITLGAPGGFIDLGSASGVNRTSRGFYKIATNSEPASYTFTSSSGNAYRVCIVRITGAPTSNPIAQAITWVGENGNSTSFTTPTRTAPSGGALQLALLAVNSASDGTIGIPSGWSTPHTTSGAPSPQCIIAGRSVAAGNTSNSVFTYSGGGTQYNYTLGTLLISSGQVVSISRSISVSHTNVRSVTKNAFTASIAPARALSITRVVLRTFSRTIAPAVTRSRLATKRITRSISTYGGYAQTTQKLLTASIAASAIVRRTPVRVFYAVIAPASARTASNIGRLFGTPGVVDITVRLAGEIRARIRRR